MRTNRRFLSVPTTISAEESRRLATLIRKRELPRRVVNEITRKREDERSRTANNRVTERRQRKAELGG